MTTLVQGNALKIGDVIECWGGAWQITKLDPYIGPHDFICAIAKGHGTTVARIGMSIETTGRYEVLNR